MFLRNLYIYTKGTFTANRYIVPINFNFKNKKTLWTRNFFM